MFFVDAMIKISLKNPPFLEEDFWLTVETFDYDARMPEITKLTMVAARAQTTRPITA